MGNQTMDIQYEEPKSLQDAEETKNRLILDVQSIQNQLGDKDRTVGGRRMSSSEYFAWRRKTLYALTCKYEELRRIKDFIRKQTNRRGIDDPVNELGAMVPTLAGIWSSVRQLQAERDQLKEENTKLKTQLGLFDQDVEQLKEIVDMKGVDAEEAQIAEEVEAYDKAQAEVLATNAA